VPPDHAIPVAEDVQHLGQKLAALMRRKAEATRIALECDIEAAKLLAQMQKQHGYRNKRYIEFVLKHGVASRSDAYDLLLLCDAEADVLEAHDDDPYYEYPSWRRIWREIKNKQSNMFWVMPPETDAVMCEELGGAYYGPCPFPCPPDHDALEIQWDDPAGVNAPFLSQHEKRDVA
jgi:hypothetical protein